MIVRIVVGSSGSVCDQPPAADEDLSGLSKGGSDVSKAGEDQITSAFVAIDIDIGADDEVAADD